MSGTREYRLWLGSESAGVKVCPGDDAFATLSGAFQLLAKILRAKPGADSGAIDTELKAKLSELRLRLRGHRLPAGVAR